MAFARHVGLAAALTLSVSLPASATPPDIINVHDDIFGISEAHVFVLRTTSDNLGLHVTGRNDVLLVATEIATGHQTIWPVYRINRGPDVATDATGAMEKTQVESWEDARNPYEILADHSGVPALAAYTLRGNENPKITLTDETLEVAYADGEAYRLETDALFDSLAATRTKLAEGIGEYDRMAPITTRELLASFVFDAQACDATEPVLLAATADSLPVQLSRVTCTAEDGMISTSHHVIVPPSRK